MDERINWKPYSCAFTGHRPESLPWGYNERDPRCVALKRDLYGAIGDAYDAGYRRFLCGMARGADFYFCEAAIAFRESHADVVLEAVIPFSGQCADWSRSQQIRYWRLRHQCNIETLIQDKYDSFCLLRRNEYMVDHCTSLIAAYNGDPSGGGTLYTLNYALERGLHIVILSI